MTLDARLPRWLRAHAAGLLSAAIYLAFLGALGAVMHYPALQDLGEWIYQARVLADIWRGSSSGVATLVSHPVPYVLPQLVMGALALVISPTGAGWGYLLLYGAFGAVSVDRFVRCYGLSPAPAAVYLTGTVLLGTGFWNGFVGAQLGLVFFLAYLSMPRELVTRWWVVAATGVVFFLTHGFAFASWGLAALVFAVAARRVGQFLLGVLPSVALTLWYLATSSQPTGAAPSTGLLQLAEYKAYTVTKLGAYQNLYVGGLGDRQVVPPLYWAGVAANLLLAAAALGVLAVLWYRSGPGRWWRSEIGAIGVGLALVALLMPQFWLGIVNPGERIANVAVVIAALPLTARAPHWGRAAVAGLAGAGLLLTGCSLASVPAKASRGHGPSQVITGERTADSLFAHRLDQFETKVSAAESPDPALPLAWSTSLLQSTTGR